MRYKATKAKAAQNMDRRAERLLSGLADVRRMDRVAKLRFPDPVPCGRLALVAHGLSKSYGSLEVFSSVDVEVQRASRMVILGLNAAGKTTMLRLLAGLDQPDSGSVVQGHGLRLGYYAQEHETLAADRTVLENLRAAAPETSETELRKILGSFLFSGEVVRQLAAPYPAAKRRGWRWPSWWCPALTCCCWTSRRTTWTRPAASACWQPCTATRARWCW
jgi:ATPase subunit of ABC transporter with duplicated ATPase domains